MSIDIAALNAVWRQFNKLQELQQEGRPPIENLVCEGGGVRMYAALGAIEILEQKGLLKDIERVAGSSAGGLVSMLLAIGYSPVEIEQVLKDELDLPKLLDSRVKWDPTRLIKVLGMKLGVSNLWHLFAHKGFFKGDKFTEITKAIIKRKLQEKLLKLLESQHQATILQIKEQGRDLSNHQIKEQIEHYLQAQLEIFLEKYQIHDLGEITFGQHQTLKEHFPELRFKELYITGTRLSDATLRVFSAQTDANMAIVDAARITMSFPFAFEPVYYQGDYYVDGGLADNTPMQIFEKEKFLSYGVNHAGVNPCTLGLLVDTEDEIAARWGEKKIKQVKLKTLMGGIIASVTARVQELRQNYDMNLVQIYDEDVAVLDVYMEEEKIKKLIASGKKSMEAYCKHYLDGEVIYSNLPDFANVYEKYYTKQTPELKRILEKDLWPLLQEVSNLIVVLNKAALKKELKIVKKQLSMFSPEVLTEQENIFYQLNAAYVKKEAFLARKKNIQKEIAAIEEKINVITKQIDLTLKTQNHRTNLDMLLTMVRTYYEQIKDLELEKKYNQDNFVNIQAQIKQLETNKIEEVFTLLKKSQQLNLFLNNQLIEQLKKTEQILNEHIDIILSALAGQNVKYPDPRLATPIERKLFLHKEKHYEEKLAYYRAEYSLEPNLSMNLAKWHCSFVDELVLYGLPLLQADKLAQKYLESFLEKEKTSSVDQNSIIAIFLKQSSNSQNKRKFWHDLFMEETSKFLLNFQESKELSRLWEWEFELQRKKHRDLQSAYIAFLTKKELIKKWQKQQHQAAPRSEKNEDFLYLNSLLETTSSLQKGNWREFIPLINRSNFIHNQQHMKKIGKETYGKQETHYAIRTLSYQPKRKGQYESFKKKYQSPPITAHILTPAKMEHAPTAPLEMLLLFEEPFTANSEQEFTMISKNADNRRQHFNQLKSRLLKQLKWSILQLQNNPQTRAEPIHLTLVGQGLSGLDAQYMLHEIIHELITSKATEYEHLTSIEILLSNPCKVSHDLAEQVARNLHILKTSRPDFQVNGYTCIQQKRIAHDVYRYKSSNLAGEANILSTILSQDGEVKVDIRDQHERHLRYKFKTNQQGVTLQDELNKSSIYYQNKFLRQTKYALLKLKTINRFILNKLAPTLGRILRFTPMILGKIIFTKKEKYKPTLKKDVVDQQNWVAKMTLEDSEENSALLESFTEKVEHAWQDKTHLLLLKASHSLEQNLNQRPPLENLVLEGGRDNICASAGALAQMQADGVLQKIKRIAGSSTGGFLAGLNAVGYSGNELADLFEHEIKFNALMGPGLIDRFFLLSKLNKVKHGQEGLMPLFKNKGIYSAKHFKRSVESLIRNKLSSNIKQMLFEQLTSQEKELLIKVPPLLSTLERNKRIEAYLNDKLKDFKKKHQIQDLGKITFSQLRQLGKDYPQLNIKDLYVTGTSLNDGSLKEFSADKEPQMSIASAIRITMSYPGAFAPKEYKDEYYIDGSIANKYPMQIFDQQHFLTHGVNDVGVNPCTLGILVDKQKDIEERWGVRNTHFKIPAIRLKRTIKAVLEGLKNRHAILKEKYNINTIQVSASMPNSVTIKEKKRRLIENGKEAFRFYNQHYLQEDIIYSPTQEDVNVYQKYLSKTIAQLQNILQEKIDPLLLDFAEEKIKIEKRARENQQMLVTLSHNPHADPDVIKKLQVELKLIETFHNAYNRLLQEKAMILRALELKGVNPARRQKRKMPHNKEVDQQATDSLSMLPMQTTLRSRKKFIKIDISNQSQQLSIQQIAEIYKPIFPDINWKMQENQQRIIIFNKDKPSESLSLEITKQGISLQGTNLQQMASMLLLYHDFMGKAQASIQCKIRVDTPDQATLFLELLDAKGFDLQKVKNVTHRNPLNIKTSSLASSSFTRKLPSSKKFKS